LSGDKSLVRASYSFLNQPRRKSAWLDLAIRQVLKQSNRFLQSSASDGLSERNSGNKVKTAQELDISRCYLHRLLNQLNITEETGKEREEESVPGANATVAV
jgi:DNA-binding NtrC family response regulator